MTSGQVYREGANKGVGMGIYLTAASIFCLTSHLNPMVALLALALLAGVPVLQYKLLLGVFRKYGCTDNFSSLWMLGISIFIGAALICAAATYCYLEFFDPHYFYDRGQEALSILEQTPELKSSELYSQMKIAVEEGILPSPIGYCVEMIMITVFSGSILTILLTPLVRLRKAKHS